MKNSSIPEQEKDIKLEVHLNPCPCGRDAMLSCEEEM
jgi:hypothetical protein